MPGRILTDWLRCPNCFADLTAVTGRTIGCRHGHRFDLDRRGHVSLLPPGGSAFRGDTATMLDARDEFLGSGAYEPIVTELVRAVGDRELSALSDLGCGTGYYAREVLAALGGSRGIGAGAPDVLVIDVSPAAVRRAHGALPGASAVVADLWSALPVRSAVADVALSIFAPRNPAEFARILSPDGLLIVVVPTPAHLQQLQTTGEALRVPPGKRAHVRQALNDHFSDLGATTIEYTRAMTGRQRDVVTAMGPMGHHGRRRTEDDYARQAETTDVTVSVDVIRFERR